MSGYAYINDDNDNDHPSILSQSMMDKAGVHPEEITEAIRRTSAEMEDLKNIKYMDLDTLSDEIPPYGRDITISHIGKILSEGWNPIAAGILTISHRTDGSFVVVDGNHRRLAAASLGITRMRAYICTGLTYEDEAVLFKLLNTKKAPAALNLLHTDVESGQAYAVDIVRILDKYGMQLAKKEGGGKARGVVSTAFEPVFAYTTLGPDGFEEIVGIVREAWGDDYEAWQAKVLGGLRTFLSRYRGEYDRASLIRRLRPLPPDEVIRSAKSSGTSGESVENKMGMKIKDIYNVRRSTKRLGEWPYLPTKTIDRVPGNTNRARGLEAMRRLKARGKVASKREE